jgi:hypothetical protein
MPEQLELDLDPFDFDGFARACGFRPSPWPAWAYWNGECVFLGRQGDCLMLEDWGHGDDLEGAMLDSIKLEGRVLQEPYHDTMHYGVQLIAPWPQTFDEAFDTFVAFDWLDADERPAIREEYDTREFRRLQRLVLALWRR